MRNIKTSEQRVLSTLQKNRVSKGEPAVHGICEMYSHADNTLAEKNCAILRYTYRSCDVAPFSDKYTPMKDVRIVSAATGYTSANRLNYILIFNEVLYIPDMTHTLINPNQCRQFWAEVQDKPYHPHEPRSIAESDESFIA